METIHKIQDTFNKASHRAEETAHTSDPTVTRDELQGEKIANRVQETVQEGAHKVVDAFHKNDTIGQKIDRVLDNATSS